MKNILLSLKRTLSIFITLSIVLIFGEFNGLSSQIIKPFTQRSSVHTPNKYIYNIKGDFTLIGNTNLTLVNYGNNTSNNEKMMYVDIDGDPNTFNSSSATLEFQSENGSNSECSNIIYAGLYWTGRAHDSNPSNMTFNVTKNYVTKQFNKRKISLKGPGASTYTDFLANSGDIYFPTSSDGYMYSAYAEVTDYVRQHGTGEYFAADIALREGKGGGTGYYGGWALVVVYENSKMNWRDITIFDGHAYVAGSITTDFTIPVSGFNTTQSGPVNMKLGLVAGEGDRNISGDYFQIRNHANNNWITLSHNGNSSNNFFNSSIFTNGNARNPNLLNNTGLDISMFNIPNANNSVITNNQHSTKFRYGTTQDTYVIFTMIMSVDAYVPEPEGMNTMVSIDNQPQIPGNPMVAEPGNIMEMTLDIRNRGNEAIDNSKVVIPIPFATSYVSSSKQLFFSPLPTPNNLYFDPLLGANGSIVWEIGTLPLPNDSDQILGTLTYKFKVTEDCNILVNTSCASDILTRGLISGVGAVSEQQINDLSSMQGYHQNGNCSGEPIYDPLEIAIDYVDYVNNNCDNNSGINNFVYCNITGGIPVTQISGNYPGGSRFYNEFPIDNNTIEYNASNPFPSDIGINTYFAVPQGGSGCFFEFTIEISSITSTPSVNTSPVEYCIGGNAIPLTATASNPSYILYFYETENGVPQTSITPDISTAGTFTYWVAEAGSINCISPNLVPITVVVNELPTAPISLHTSRDNLCANDIGSITLTATGGAGNEIVWFDDICNGNEIGTGNNLTIVAPQSTTTYYAAYQNDCGISDCAQITVIVSTQIEAIASADLQVSCFDASDATLTVNANGGTGIYSYILNGGTPQSSNVFENLAAGSYTVEILDEMGCSVNVKVEIKQPELVSLDYLPYCREGSVGVNLIASGGSGNYQYSIDGGITYSNSGNFENLINETTITIIAIDEHNCSSAAKIVAVESLNTLEASATIISHNSCYGVADAIVEFNITGGVEPYVYTLNNETVYYENIIGSLPAGENIITIQDSNGCPAETEVEIEARENIEFEILSKTSADCNGNSDGSAEVEISGGVTPYNYQWSDGSNQNFITDLGQGTYTLTVTDLLGCEKKFKIEIDSEQIYDLPEVNNVFTPNNDGINDFFIVSNLELYPDNELVVLNRWGNEVYSKKSYNNSWDGSNLTEGTYFYVLKVRMCDEYQTINGYITILD